MQSNTLNSSAHNLVIVRMRRKNKYEKAEPAQRRARCSLGLPTQQSLLVLTGAEEAAVSSRGVRRWIKARTVLQIWYNSSVHPNPLRGAAMKPPAEFHDAQYQIRLIEQGAREQIVRWLCWNDPNGTYSDRDSEIDGMKAMTLDEARQIMANQISR